MLVIFLVSILISIVSFFGLRHEKNGYTLCVAIVALGVNIVCCLMQATRIYYEEIQFTIWNLFSVSSLPFFLVGLWLNVDEYNKIQFIDNVGSLLLVAFILAVAFWWVFAPDFSVIPFC